MNDPRISRLAEILIDHSCQLKAGEFVLIEAFDLPEPALASEDAHLCPQTITITTLPLQMDTQIMTAPWSIIAQEQGRPLILAHQDVEIAVAIVVGIGGPAPNQGTIETAAWHCRNLSKFAIPQILEQLRRLRARRVPQSGLVDDVAVNHEEIFKSIQVDIKEKQPEGDIWQCRTPDASPC